MSDFPLRIRTAGLQDCDAVTDLHTRSRSDYYRGAVTDAEPADAAGVERRRAWWEQQLRSEKHTIFLAERDGMLLGFADIGACRFPDPDPLVGGEMHMYVDPGSLRQGVGRRLHATCLRTWQDASVAAARLWVQDFNIRAQAFYRSQGWQADGHHRPDSPGLIGYRLLVPATDA